jgi:hypothetical protein
MLDHCEISHVQMYSDLYNIEPAPKTYEVSSVNLTSTVLCSPLSAAVHSVSVKKKKKGKGIPVTGLGGP